MSFIPRSELEGRNIGAWVRLTRDVDVISGKFESGTRMRIISDGPRGLNLEDEHGHQLCETGFLGLNFFKPEDTRTTQLDY